MSDLITLENDVLSVGITPAVGATVTRLAARLNGNWTDVMRPAPDPIGRSSNGNFVMAPYSNRIRDAHFVFRNNSYQLKNAEKHAIHGDVRDRPWEVCEVNGTRAVLELASRSFSDFNFPFPLKARISYELDGAAIKSSLSIVNEGDAAFPAGGGFHPYFNKALGSVEEVPEIQFKAKGVYLYDGDLPLPKGPMESVPSALSFDSPKKLPDGLDHCYGGWDGRAVLRWPQAGVALNFTASTEMTHLIVYSPPGQSFFAFEPATMATDGFNAAESGRSETGVIILEPGAGFTAWYRAAISEV